MSNPNGLCFSATVKSLATAIAPLVAVSTRKPTIEVLKYLRFTATGAKVVARATDLIVDITVELDATATVAGEALIEGKRLSGLLSGLDDGDLITLTAIKGGQMLIETRNHSTTLQAPPVGEFPFVREPTPGQPTVIQAHHLAALFKQVAVTAPATDYQNAPNAIWLTATTDPARLFARSLDGHRGTVASVKAETVDGITSLGMIAKHSLALIGGIFNADHDIEIRRHDGDVEFRAGLSRCVVKETDQPTPALDRVVELGHAGAMVEFDRLAALGAIRRCMVIAAGDGNELTVRLSFEGRVMTAKSEKSSIGTSENTVPLVTDSIDMPAASFNGRYLYDALNTITSERVTLKVSVGQRPALLQQAVGEPTDYLCVVMPFVEKKEK